MKQYIGTKVVNATPAWLVDNKVYLKDEAVPRSMNRKDGYIVVYDGYESWSPKSVFEKAYREVGTMDFGGAMHCLKAGVFWDSWDGLLNVTQTGMNSSGEPFTFSMDNDRNDQQKLIDTLVKAQVEGWKVKIKYHQVWGAKNVFNNRGESDYFVDDVIILDKNFSKIGDIVKGTNKTAPHDTLYVKIVE